MDRMLSQYVEFTKSLFAENYLDEQFQQLQQLQDESTPDFVREVVKLFFDDCNKIVNELIAALKQRTVDFKVVDGNVHQLKGSSSRVKYVCINFHNFCEQRNYDGKCLQELQHECSQVQQKLQYIFMMEEHIVAKGGSIPIVKLPDPMML
ncbi:hypothetical protein ACHQM5_023264 [Ranunculus cassubicifolius]